MGQGTILLLNGASSSGKTRLARALVERLPGFFALSLDEYDLLIERMEDRPRQRLVPVETEYFFHRTIALFSERGVPLVVDTILHDDFTRADIAAALAGCPVVLVGVFCPLEELERRERLRGDRSAGQARSQLDFIHQGICYDLEVDATQPPDDCAEQVARFLEQGQVPTGWARTRAALAPGG